LTLRLLKDGATVNTIPVICPVKNEMPLLPHFLDHYRRLGVQRFIFIDNASTDNGTDYLCAQPDCRVYFTEQDYRESQFATSWINEIIEREPLEGWLLYADVDEHLIFPDCETTSIAKYCDRLSRQGFDAAYAIMLDMYPQDNFLSCKPSADLPLAKAMPWFDTDYVIRSWPLPPWKRGLPKHPPQILGGPRCRIQSSLEKEVRRSWPDYFWLGKVDRFIDFVPKRLLPTLAKIWPADVPALYKTPLNFVRPGFKYWNSHTATNSAFSGELLVLLHFKFCAELQARWRMVHADANHYRRGLHYLQLQQALARWRGGLIYEGSAKFNSSEDLARVGILGSDASHVWLEDKISVHRSKPRPAPPDIAAGAADAG
jgi:Glycosyl transferase family 2